MTIQAWQDHVEIGVSEEGRLFVMRRSTAWPAASTTSCGWSRSRRHPARGPDARRAAL